MSKLIFASVISEIQQSDVFMTVKARICEAPQANLNGARVTEAFIDEIVSNVERYVGLPLYADKKALISGEYTRLGHLYDAKTGEFHSTQVGSFYKFEKQPIDGGCALVGYARIPKRNKKLSKAISSLFADGALKFSFELSVGEYEELDDDTILIDASENNYLEGTAIVTYPACEEAVALELVAQKADETRKGDEEMAEVQTQAEVIETEAVEQLAEEAKEVASEPAQEVTTDEVVAEEETACKDKENSEDETACKDKENSEEEDAACKKEKGEETAAVVVREYHEQRDTQCAYDTESGKEVCQTVTVETHSTNVSEGTLVEAVDGVHVAENVIAEPGEGDTDATDNETPAEDLAETPVETPVAEAEDEVEVVNVEDNKKTAEQMIAELLEVVNGLKSEIAELKEAKKATVTAEVNPFMGTISSTGKYSLLQKETRTVNSYGLLSKA